jgi:hypothetical protein
MNEEFGVYNADGEMARKYMSLAPKILDYWNWKRMMHIMNSEHSLI